MFFDGTNAHVTYADILTYIVAWFAKHNTPFTVSQMVDDAVNTISNVTTEGRKLLRNRLSIRLKRMVEVGCLSYTHNPAPQANDYDITNETMNILTEPTHADKVAALLAHFNLFDQPTGSRALTPITRQTKQKTLPFSGKTAGTSKEAEAMRQMSGGMTCTMPNGATINFNNVAQLTEFVRQMGSSTIALPRPPAADVIDFRTTVTRVLFDQANQLRETILSLSNSGAKNNKVLSLRFLSLALSQWDRFLAGVKYDIAYNFCMTADDVPCNVDDCDTVGMSPDVRKHMCDYLREFAEHVASLAENHDSEFTLPTMQADGEKIPCSFRAPGMVEWMFNGKALPEHLKKKMPIKENDTDA